MWGSVYRSVYVCVRACAGGRLLINHFSAGISCYWCQISKVNVSGKGLVLKTRLSTSWSIWSLSPLSPSLVFFFSYPFLLQLSLLFHPYTFLKFKCHKKEKRTNEIALISSCCCFHNSNAVKWKANWGICLNSSDLSLESFRSQKSKVRDFSMSLNIFITFLQNQSIWTKQCIFIYIYRLCKTKLKLNFPLGVFHIVTEYSLFPIVFSQWFLTDWQHCLCQTQSFS